MRRVTGSGPAEHVLEIVTPRTNVARLSSAEHVFGALVPRERNAPEPVSLEIVGDADQRRFFARANDADALRRVAGQLGAAYPQADLRKFHSATFPTGDPAQVGPDEQVAAATLQLRAGDHLPLRTFEDRELDSVREGAQVDPLLAVLGALSNLPTGWRALVQLVVLAPAPPGWARAYQRLALERPLDQERRADTGPSPVGPLAILGLIGLYLAGSSASEAWSRGDWLWVLELVGGGLAVLVGGVVVLRWLRKRELVDPRLVQAKLSRGACTVELPLAVIAPDFADSDAVHARLDRLVAAYRPFALATGNAFVPRPARRAALDLRVLVPIGRPNLLNVRELAGLWHLPQAGDDCGADRATLAVNVPTNAAIRWVAPVPAPHAPSVGVPSLSPITGTRAK